MKVVNQRYLLRKLEKLSRQSQARRRQKFERSWEVEISATIRLRIFRDSTSCLMFLFFCQSQCMRSSLLRLKNCLSVSFLFWMFLSSYQLTSISCVSLSCCRYKSFLDYKASIMACDSAISSLSASNKSQQFLALHSFSTVMLSLTCSLLASTKLTLSVVLVRWFSKLGSVSQNKTREVLRYQSLLFANLNTYLFRLIKQILWEFSCLIKGYTWSLIKTASSPLRFSSAFISGNACQYRLSMSKQGRGKSFSSSRLRLGLVEVRNSWNQSHMNTQFIFTQLFRKYVRYLILSLTTFKELLPEECLAGSGGIMTPGQRFTNTSRRAENQLYLRYIVKCFGDFMVTKPLPLGTLSTTEISIQSQCEVTSLQGVSSQSRKHSSGSESKLIW